MEERFWTETELEVRSFLTDLRYALDAGAKVKFQIDRRVEQGKDQRHTNLYTVSTLFQNEKPTDAIKRELYSLTVEEYMRTVKDIRFPELSPMREFGRVYDGNMDVYIKVRVELLSNRSFGEHTAFVMSFHFAERPLADETFPYRR